MFVGGAGIGHPAVGSSHTATTQGEVMERQNGETISRALARKLCQWPAGNKTRTGVDLPVSEFRFVENVQLATRNVPEPAGQVQSLFGHLG